MAEFPAPKEGILLTHFIVSDDVERSRRFYTEVLGGETLLEGAPTIVALANGWVTINVGGGPTEDKPTVTLETPPDPNRTSSSSTSGSRTSRPSTPRGARAEPSFSRRRRIAEARSDATCAIRMGT
jgi:catechol 2,3-dioxygenase-like lactoylglutathione lyase family enzyme